MPSRGELVNELSKLVSRILSREVVLTESTAIYHDLSIAGDDAWELLEDINKQYGTSFQELSFELYFPDESEAFLKHIGKILFGLRDKKHRRLTVSHIVDVVQRGYWFDPDCIEDNLR